ncbi:hypothetical protein BO94DRAFT_215126 [Aspergillus sclerotioniger CBS 115572]|uniref:Uncharacterized protein n=1 Tax=Aspergillus sclerotioniger CBS 115572 TaxID=1450535 RepID=A0A317X8M4_9EURO|nr:hypothetical protein BO94DRAFT_215126 [Aspergillus sclerotioniger CBS 115572]PWY94954.1 hypothetical protein BO94DRAFT_215126 [Aspergillus sclerotioniger CBS 115572]
MIKLRPQSKVHASYRLTASHTPEETRPFRPVLCAISRAGRACAQMDKGISLLDSISVIWHLHLGRRTYTGLSVGSWCHDQWRLVGPPDPRRGLRITLIAAPGHSSVDFRSQTSSQFTVPRIFWCDSRCTQTRLGPAGLTRIGMASATVGFVAHGIGPHRRYRSADSPTHRRLGFRKSFFSSQTLSPFPTRKMQASLLYEWYSARIFPVIPGHSSSAISPLLG